MLFNKDNPKLCQTCAWADSLPDGLMLCYHKGPTVPDYVCRKYRYDPYKRIPQAQPKLRPYPKQPEPSGPDGAE